jgi:hypothetical protein
LGEVLLHASEGDGALDHRGEAGGDAARRLAKVIEIVKGGKKWMG